MKVFQSRSAASSQCRSPVTAAEVGKGPDRAEPAVAVEAVEVLHAQRQFGDAPAFVQVTAVLGDTPQGDQALNAREIAGHEVLGVAVADAEVLLLVQHRSRS